MNFCTLNYLSNTYILTYYTLNHEPTKKLTGIKKQTNKKLRNFVTIRGPDGTGDHVEKDEGQDEAT